MNTSPMKRLLALGAAVAALQAGAALARPQTNVTQDGAARAGSNAGSSSIAPTRASRKTAMHKPAHTTHRTAPSTTTGMGSQAANATGPAANSH